MVPGVEAKAWLEENEQGEAIWIHQRVVIWVFEGCYRIAGRPGFPLPNYGRSPQSAEDALNMAMLPYNTLGEGY